MLVIHPKDKTTAMLSILYEGIDNVNTIDQSYSKRQVNHALNCVLPNEYIMLLGHGSDDGLFSRVNDGLQVFDRIIVGHQQCYYLRKHRAHIIAIWCNANLFGESEGLHGLFSGMIITEMKEAYDFGVDTSQEELDLENIKLAYRLRTLLNENVPLIDIPTRMLALDDVHSSLTRFNYRNFYYL